MRLANEDGLDSWGIPLENYRFNFEEADKLNAITITLDEDLYVVGVWDNAAKCKGKARNFVGKYKIPVKVYTVEIKNDKLVTELQYEYTYEFYQKWKEKYGN